MKLNRALAKSAKRHRKCTTCNTEAALEHGTYSMRFVKADAYGKISVRNVVTTEIRFAMPCEVLWMKRSRRWYPL